MYKRSGAVILASVLGATAASADSSGSRVFGYQDTKTGTFHALTAVVPEAVAATTGTIHVTFNIKLVTAFPKGTLLNCNASVIASSLNETALTTTTYEESASDSVAISGTTATCTAVIPYSWLLTPAGSTVSDTFSGSYTVSAIAGSATVGTPMLRSSSSSLFTTSKIPASGITSAYTVNVTL